MPVHVTIDPQVKGLAVGLVEAADLKIEAPRADLIDHCQEQVRQVAAHDAAGGDALRQAVRQLLRAGGFKPSGRNKPAQEYLYRTAQEPSAWPIILNAVDVLNVLSLRSGLPISLVCPQRVGERLLIRYGREGEQFVFNRSGQVLDVSGLLCLCQVDGQQTVPVGSPVKDSQDAKVTSEDHHGLACLFAPQAALAADCLLRWSEELGDGLRRWCGARDVRVWLEPSAW